MKRIATLTMMGAILASVIGLSSASAGHDCELGARNYAYKCEHPRLSSLPIQFKVNLSSRPSGLSAEQVTNAVAGAIAEWNRAWPLPSGNLTCPVLCLSSSSTSKSGVSLGDGENTISWSHNVGPCGGGAHAGIAVACVRYEGNSGTARHRIAEVDIVLSPDRLWYQPRLLGGGANEPRYVVAGEVAGIYPELGNNGNYDQLGGGQGKYDVQSTLTHELGHALGLRDIGDPDVPWPAALLDTDAYQQTMYRWYHRGTTNKRTLAEGDIAGVQRIAFDVLVAGD